MNTPMIARFRSHLSSISDTALLDACAEILKEQDFFTHPASLSFHHAYEGGLLAHTVEVTDYALGIAKPLIPVNTDILIAASVWHDFCKVREYRLVDHMAHVNPVDGDYEGFGSGKEWVGTEYAKLIHHIPGSAIEFTVAARKHGVAESIIEQVQHCILAHHGRREWGSPVEPQTLEALILHQADLMSARFGATKDRMP